MKKLSLLMNIVLDRLFLLRPIRAGPAGKETKGHGAASPGTPKSAARPWVALVFPIKEVSSGKVLAEGMLHGWDGATPR